MTIQPSDSSGSTLQPGRDTGPIPSAEARSFAPVATIKPAAKVFFGGPDRQAGALRDLLEARVEAVAPGGSIDWMTYYFRDQRLADALIRAHRRGVMVRVCVEGSPRYRGANDKVIRKLAEGIGLGLTAVRHAVPLHLHAKIYAFSGPEPCALVGSFNPSCDGRRDDRAVIADLGDQDRGHNLLVEVSDPAMVAALVGRVAAVHAGAGALKLATAPRDATVATSGYEAVFFPYFPSSPLERRLERLSAGATLRIAASHLRDLHFAEQLTNLASRGVQVNVLTHHTARRAPHRIERQLLRGGVSVTRYAHPESLPMHCKFFLAQDGHERWVAFGSYNLTRTSRWLNQELLMFCQAPALWAELDGRWAEIMAEPWVIPGDGGRVERTNPWTSPLAGLH
jgi:phosphatidylserine/phosphatidylglycerophosphate/cardiolipin synthase-like enzyme